jgi:hypothetical protein
LYEILEETFEMEGWFGGNKGWSDGVFGFVGEGGESERTERLKNSTEEFWVDASSAFVYLLVF